MHINHYFIGAFIATLPFSSFANSDFPMGFQDYFIPEEKVVDISIAGDVNGASLKGEATFDSFKSSEHADFNAAYVYLNNQGLSDEIVAKIQKDLQQGIAANPGCSSNLENCVVQTTATQQIKYLFDYELGIVRIFVAPELLRNSSVSEYHSAIQEDFSLISTSQLDINSNFSDATDFSLDNTALLGLPLGYINTDVQYSSADNHLDVYSAHYNIDYKGSRFQLGKIQSSYSALNTTDFLFNDASYDAYNLSWSSSSNLVKKSTVSSQSINFFAPQAGRLEVYRDERLLFTRTVSQGKQVISYDELPKGAYTLRLKLKIGEQIAFEDSRLIVNNADFMLERGDWDYSYSVGQFDMDSASEEDVLVDGGAPWFWKASHTYRPFDSTLVGLSFMGSESSLYTLGGVKYVYADGIDLSATFGYFSNGDVYNSSNITFTPFMLTWSQLKANQNDKTGLSRYIYDSSSFDKLSASVNGTLFGGSAYLNYSLFGSSDSESQTQSRSLSGVWSHDLLGGLLSFNTSYSMPKGGDNELSFGLVWSRSLTERMSYSLSAYMDDNGFNHSASSLSHSSQLHDLWYMSNSLTSRFNRNRDVDLDYSFSVTGEGDYLNSQLYGYMSNQGNRSASLSLSGTQVLTRNGLNFTSKQSESYLEVDIDGPFEPSRDPLFYNIKAQGIGYAQRDKLHSSSALVPLSPYSAIQAKLDTESDLVNLSNKTGYYFTVPGGVYTLASSMEQLKSKIYVMSDINDKPIRELQCRGEGCVLVEPVTNDGVFRVNYKEGLRYELYSAQNLCVSPVSGAKAQYISGYCLPGIENDGSLLASEPSRGQDIVSNRVLFYLGKFDSRASVDKVLSKLGSVDIQAKIIEIDPDLYVYVDNTTNHLSMIQKDVLTELNAFVIPESKEFKYLSFNELYYDF